MKCLPIFLYKKSDTFGLKVSEWGICFENNYANLKIFSSVCISDIAN